MGTFGKVSKLKIVKSILVIVFFSYLLPCAFEDKLLFLEKCLSDQASGLLLSFLKSFWFMGIALLVYIVLEVWEDIRDKNRILTGVYNKLCCSIFNECLKSLPQENDKMRVSLFKAQKGQLWKHEETDLKFIGRYQTRNHPRAKCRVVFKPGEGCVGKSYETNKSFLRKHIDEYDKHNPTRYFEESREVFNLPHHKTKKLHIKACDFLCLPVKFPGQDEAWGVLSLDSTENNTFEDKVVARMREKLNSILIGFSAYLDVI
jgi:hypothetical protein